MPHQPIDEVTRECIDSCNTCHNVCQETSAYCLSQGGKHTEPNHFRLMLDCVETCHVSSDLMLASSHWSDAICEVCADVCDACADSCATFENDETMLKCADACRNCAESCRKMTTHHGRRAA